MIIDAPYCNNEVNPIWTTPICVLYWVRLRGTVYNLNSHYRVDTNAWGINHPSVAQQTLKISKMFSMTTWCTFQLAVVESLLHPRVVLTVPASYKMSLRPPQNIHLVPPNMISQSLEIEKKLNQKNPNSVYIEIWIFLVVAINIYKL